MLLFIKISEPNINACKRNQIEARPDKGWAQRKTQKHILYYRAPLYPSVEMLIILASSSQDISKVSIPLDTHCTA